MSNDKPSTVRDLRAAVVDNMSKGLSPLGSGDSLELRFPQKLRALAAGAVFEACRPHFTPEDEEDLGYVLGQLSGWVLHGSAYDPDLDDDMVEGLGKAVA